VGASPGVLKRLFQRLAHTEHCQEADHASRGNVVADPGDVAMRLQKINLVLSIDFLSEFLCMFFLIYDSPKIL
jgi:hypothetical protein